MGIFDKLKGQVGAQFLDVIEWTSDDSDVIAWRFPIFNKAIRKFSTMCKTAYESDVNTQL